MNKLGINDKGLGVFRRIANTTPKVKENQQNPFAVSFGSKVLTRDVFELSNPVKKGVKELLNDNVKSYQKNVTEFINNSKAFIAKKAAPVVDFAKTVKNQVTEAWNKLNSIEIKKPNLKEMFAHLKPESENKGIAKEVLELMKKPVNELEAMFKAEIV